MNNKDDSYEFGMKKKQYDKETLKELKKDFFVETEAYKKITEKEAKEFLDKHELKVFGNKIPKPSINFESTSFPGKID
jgi:ATP-dependent RNA helicase DDX5/DBP2